MKLETYAIKKTNFIDNDTLTDYAMHNGDNTIKICREVYKASGNELVLDGHHFVYHVFNEEGMMFATLTPYSLNPSICSKRTFRFGVINTKNKSIRFFFRGKNLGKNRQQAVEVFNELVKYCQAQGRHFLPFAMK